MAKGDQNNLALEQRDIDPTLVKAGVKSAQFFRASPAAVTDAKTGRVLAKATGAGMAGDGFVALAKAGEGDVIVLGQSLWWNWIAERQAAGTDNTQLLRWLLEPQQRE